MIWWVKNNEAQEEISAKKIDGWLGTIPIFYNILHLFAVTQVRVQRVFACTIPIWTYKIPIFAR